MTFAAGSGDAPARPNWALELSGVSRRFGGLRAVNAVNLNVAAGVDARHHRSKWGRQDDLFALISGELRSRPARIRMFGRISAAGRPRGGRAPAWAAPIRSRTCSPA